MPHEDSDVISFGTHWSRWAPCCSSARGDALSGVYFDGQKYQPPMRARTWRPTPRHPRIAGRAGSAREYFAGVRTRFDLPLAAGRNAVPARRSGRRSPACPSAQTIDVRASSRCVPAGRGSVRAAGAATGRNPLSVIVPCHRIVGGGGALTGYAGGLERKRALLALESRLRVVQRACGLKRARRPTSRRLVALAAIWSASFVFIRVLAPVLGPVVTAALARADRRRRAGASVRATGFDAELSRLWRALSRDRRRQFRAAVPALRVRGAAHCRRRTR